VTFWEEFLIFFHGFLAAFLDSLTYFLIFWDNWGFFF